EAAGRAAPSSGDPALATRIAALETEVKTLAEAVGALARRNEETLAAARAALAELAQKLPDASAAVRSELEGLASRVTGVERGQKFARRYFRRACRDGAAAAASARARRGLDQARAGGDRRARREPPPLRRGARRTRQVMLARTRSTRSTSPRVRGEHRRPSAGVLS